MNFRLQQFLSAENITQSQLADEIGVARASISHILAGRNKPGFDFIQGLSRSYPNLNLDWLINGKGKMYKDLDSKPEQNTYPADGQLFAAQVQDPQPEVAETAPAPLPMESAPVEEKSTTHVDNNVKILNNKILQQTPAPSHQVNARRISRIVIFYDDNTYQELREV